MKVAVVGATGMVGQVMLKVLEERDFRRRIDSCWFRQIDWKRNLLPRKSIQVCFDVRCRFNETRDRNFFCRWNSIA